jgi:hypothetical protein
MIESNRTPASYVLAFLGWAGCFLWFCWMAIVFAQIWDWRGILVGLSGASFFAAIMQGLLSRSTKGWWLGCFVSKVLSLVCLSFFLAGVVVWIYMLFDGAVPDKGLLADLAHLFFYAVAAFMPAGYFGAIYYAQDSPEVRQYCRVCPNCAKRIRWPLDLLSMKFVCDKCLSAC